LFTNFQSRVYWKIDDAAAAPVAAEKEPQTSGRSSRLGRSARRPRIRPCRSSRSKATNLKICLTPNGTADRSATNFERKIFEGKNFVCRRLFFWYLPGFTGLFFRTIFVRKKLWDLQFSRHATHAPQKFLSICDLQKFSRNSKIYTRCFCRVSVYPLRYSKSKISISQFSTKIDPCFYLIKSILRS
jgi:hypothetical protein